MAWRNCESYVSRAVWDGEVDCPGKREHVRAQGRQAVCCLRPENVHGRQGTHGVLKEHRRDRENESNLHTTVQRVMKSDSSAGGDREGRSSD